MEANQLAAVTELSRRLVHTFPSDPPEVSAITTPSGEAGPFIIIGHTSPGLPSAVGGTFNDLEKLRRLSSRLCLFLLLMWDDSRLLADPPSMLQGDVTFPKTSSTAESQTEEDHRFHEPPGLQTAEVAEIAVHPQVAFGIQSLPQVEGIVPIPSQMMWLIPGQCLSPSLSIELPDEFDD